MPDKHEILAVIPARGGSKGVPRKNIRLLSGKPLISWTISTALKTECLNRVIVSTDDEEIADISKQSGAEVPFIRPQDFAQDETSDFPVYKHALEWLKENENYSPDIIVWLRPTAPLRTKDDIDCAVKIFINNKLDWVRSVCKVEHHPFWMYKIEDNYSMNPFIDGIDIRSYLRRQNLPAAYRINGAVDVTCPNVLKNESNLYYGNMKAYVMPAERSIDIDTEIDFLFLEKFISSGQV